MCKVWNNICPPIMNTFFDFREHRYNIRKFQEMRQQKVRSIRYVSDMCPICVRYGLETALYRAPQLWSLVPADLQLLPNTNLFKSKVNHWECTECPCKLCKTYLRLGLCLYLRLCLTFPRNQLSSVIKL